ncbi:MAG TPA: DUF2703 domain-containing protein [Gammaproteobacteria bacterium]|nr:DUF2703 domain-containing protein [Gammaproteobacteria bacterium]
MSNCGCNIDAVIDAAKKKNESRVVNIQLLYLDLEVCEPCQETDNSLDTALAEVSELLEKSGHAINLEKIHIDSEEKAIIHKFLSSPTIRINGQDIQLNYKEDHCSTCSSLTEEASVDCRTWVYDGEEYQAPPKQMIIDSILKYVYSNEKQDLTKHSSYQLPDNLKVFFESQTNDKSSCCSNNSEC